ncbi:PREDICTED: uncharacterized protein C9orf9 homolog [Myotis davidii]|uniref:uncharacterized protein C9orf9 homolog n=1 Tax=Myotis davidii TaxID=225400 RepID=UPI000767001E|nr:PREDICTED: uncharacterized protein C9orf9 homolog [Myotis davidii]
MNEAKESLRSIEQKYKLFQQQQFTFVAALEHCRENAHDKIKPITSIEQVQSYTEHYCTNSTDRRILLMFLDICTELSRLCQRFETLHPGTPITNSFLDKCKTFVSQSNDLSSLRAKYPHDVVNHLSCDEARNHYGGVHATRHPWPTQRLRLSRQQHQEPVLLPTGRLGVELWLLPRCQ